VLEENVAVDIPSLLAADIDIAFPLELALVWTSAVSKWM
jgi:hypothetical protein